MTKVFFATPTAELGRFPKFWLSLQHLILPEGVTVDPASNAVAGAYTSNNQNALARMFMASDADYFWLLNDDQIYPPQTLARLLAYNKDVIVPLCLRHDLPCEPLIFDRIDPDCPDNYFYHFLQKDDPELLPIVSAGGGGALIHRRVLEAIPDPWWETHTVHAPGWLPVQSTEDHDFFKKVRETGFQLWAAMEVSVFHETIFSLAPARTPEGEWVTVIQRNDRQFAIPAATKPPDPVKPEAMEELVTQP